MNADEFYRVEGRDKTVSSGGRRLRWLGTVVSGLFDAGSSAAPALSELVIVRVVDGAELRVIAPSFVDEFEETFREITADLESLDDIDFARKWLDLT